MSKQLIIEQKNQQVAIAFLEDKKLWEYHIEEDANHYNVGDFYLGKVKKIIPGMNAAFVDVGHEKDGFLHYTDLSPFIRTILKFTQILNQQNELKGNFDKLKIEEEIVKKGKIEEILKSKPYLLVQVLKEPISNKGPRLTCEFTLTGRHLVLRPFANDVSVSKKIFSSEERKRLKKIVIENKNNNFGVIIRTAAHGKEANDIIEDYQQLEQKWKEIQLKMLQAKAPLKIRQEDAKTMTIIRDLLTREFTTIAVNNPSIALNLKSYLKKIAPEKSNILKEYATTYSVMDSFGVTKQLNALFGKNVILPSGAYLFIEKTEALHVIDVNSGNRVVATNQEENALQTNLEATDEIARQLRLRDLGGIIIVDFIDMKLPENKKKVYERMYKNYEK